MLTSGLEIVSPELGVKWISGGDIFLTIAIEVRAQKANRLPATTYVACVWNVPSVRRIKCASSALEHLRIQVRSISNSDVLRSEPQRPSVVTMKRRLGRSSARIAAWAIWRVAF
jgi:hypothetical protein